MELRFTSRHIKFAKLALQLADLDNGMHYSLCAIIIKKNRVLSVGYNQSKTHSISKDTVVQMIHAEMHAILKCQGGALKGAEMIVARARADRKAGLAKPCSVCQGILRRCGIKRVLYTTNWDDDTTSDIQELRF
jgi:deoxycytidylate deaminase